MRFYDFLLVSDITTEETNERLKGLTRPQSLKFSRVRAFRRKAGQLIGRVLGALSGRRKTPENLDALEIGKYLYLSTLEGEDFVFEVFSVIGGLTKEDALDLRTEDAVGFLNFARSGLEEISEAIAAQRIEPTADEKAAGSEDLDGGVFGMLDYLSRRQRISHEEAERLPWPTVVAMLKADKDAELYRRKLQKQLTKK